MLWPTSKLMHCNIYLLQTGALSNNVHKFFQFQNDIHLWRIISCLLWRRGLRNFAIARLPQRVQWLSPPSLSLGSTNFSPGRCLWCATHFSPLCYMPIAVFTQCTSCCAIMCYVVQWSAMHYAGSALQGIQCTSVQCAMCNAVQIVCTSVQS